MTTFLWILTGGFVLGLILLIFFGITKRPVGILVSIILSATCLLCFVVNITIEPKKNIDNTGQQEVSETKEVNTATFDEIYYAYKENELVADDLYQYNRYRVTAKINGMTNDGLFNMTGGAMLTLETKVDNTIVFFYAEFEKEQEENLKSVKVGDTITFEGKCLDAGNWTECELIVE